MALLLLFVGAGPAWAQEDVAALQSKANSGDPVALNALGNMYANGQGVTRDDKEALKRYEQAAEQAYAPANFNLGMMHELGRGVPADIAKAFAYYLRAAQQGFAPAQFNVGNMYAGGLGVAQDNFEAVLWFRQAAEQGVVEAQYNLGLAYEMGRGVSADAAQAQRWYGLSAQQGYARAAYNLAVMLEEGRGSAKDEATAAKLYLTSARQGFGPAQNNYGIMLAEGRGGLRADPVEALIWLNLAVQNGVSPLGRDMVAKQVTPVQLAEANARLVSMRAGAAGTSPVPTQASTPVAPPARGDEAARQQLAALQAENQRLLAGQQQLEQERADLAARLQASTAENKKLSANIDAFSQAQAAAQKDPNTDPKLAYYIAENARLNDEVTRSTKELSSLFRELRIATDKLNAVSPTAANAPAASASETETKLREDLAALRAENHRLIEAGRQAKVEGLAEAEMQTLRAKAAAGEKAMANLDAVTRNVAILTQELAATQQARDAAVVANKDLTAQLAAAAASKQHEAESQRLEEVIAQSQSDLVSTRRELEEMRVQLMAAQAETKLRAAQASKDTQQAQAKSADAAAAARELLLSNQQLTAEVDALQQALDAQANAGSEDPADRQKLAQELHANQMAFRKLSDEMTVIEQERDRLVQEKESAREQVGKLQQALAAAEGANPRATALERELIGTRDTVSQLTMQLNATEAERARLAGEQADRATVLAGLQQQLQAAQGSQQDVLASLQTQLDAAGKRITIQQMALTKAEDTKQSLEKSVTDMQRQLADLTAENQRLTASSRNGGAQSTAAQANLSAQLDDAARGIAERDAAISELKDKVASLQQDLENSRMSADAALAAQARAAQAFPDAQATMLELKTLQAQVNQLETQLAQERANSASQVASLAQQLNLVSETNKSLTQANRALIMTKSSDVDSLQAELQQSRNRLAEQTAINQQLTQERDEQRSQVEGMFAKLSATEKQLADLQLAEAAARAAADKAQTEWQTLQRKYADVDTALDRQGGAVAELTGLNESLTKEKTRLQAQLTQALARSEQTQADLTKLQIQLEEQNRTVATLTTDAGEDKARVDALQTQLDTTAAQLAALQVENSRLTSADTLAADLQNQLAASQDKLAETERTAQVQAGKASQLSDENAQLTQQLAAVTAQLQTLRSENTRLANATGALAEAQSRINALTATAAQVGRAQQDLAAQRTENARLNDTLQALERDRTSRIASLEKENTALTARLRQAQGTLDQIATAARYMNPGSANNNPATNPGTPRAVPPSAPARRLHTVVAGDSLSRISMQYYGTSTRWQEIYEANREVLSAENVLRPGQQLILP